ncbi:LysR family transcriptional regulator [Rhodobacter sp. 24-YEA-8]|uniref:LysR family transcriptional regulator n=1 Tax=Rhodobacter sp. 24-YEA-8 TaxID=1884310 RepID=UPI0008982A7B|nr:LysR family transcriptional regulator [Rhodobacter sp. 24-YEA-8]SED51046.1 DNA-binding transcriptional regulator, LysR family [Rhodobacter sp. 24-YEA-8]
MVVSVSRILSRLRMRQFSLLVALDQHRSLRRAAAELAITQSAASKALAEIEDIIGSVLFERSPSGLSPTELGQCLIRYAWLMRADVESMCIEIGTIQLGHARRLSVGTIMGAIPDVFAQSICTLREEFPDLSLQIIEDTSAGLLEALDQNRIDLAIGRVMVSPNPGLYNYEPLWTEPLHIAVGSRHPLAHIDKPGLADLARYSWIVYPSLMPLRAMLERTLSNAGIQLPTNVIETSSTFATVALLVRDPGLVALLPAAVCRFFEAEHALKILPLDIQGSNPDYGIITRSGGALSGPAQSLLRILRGAQDR